MPATERRAARQRPVLFVLAGVNGAGKSSVGGHLLARAGLPWFNPDTFARELRDATGCDQRTANIAAWHEGVRRLDAAIAKRRSFAIETTLGGLRERVNGARILASTLGEVAVLTELTTGKHLAEIEGDGEPISTLTITPSASHLIVCSRSLTMRSTSPRARRER